MAGGVNLKMLMIPEKKTSSLDLYRPLRNYIASQYSEKEAQKLEDDLQAVRQLRSDIEKPLTLDALIAYYSALCAIEFRFPISADRDDVSTVSFTWFDAFSRNKKASLKNVHFEKAAVIFNLGAVHSQIAFAADRRTSEGLKLACNSFQAAAGVFLFLRDYVSVKTSVGSSATVDLSGECAAALERFMLGQAQECFFEKAVSDRKSPALCSKIARQASLYYEEASAAFSLPPLNQHLDRMWISHAQLKAAFFYAEACYQIGLDLHEKEEIAEEITRLRSGISAITDSKKSFRGASQSLLDAVNDLECALNLSLEKAQKENDRVYLMRIPPISSLSPLLSVSLVKSLPINSILDPTKEQLFASLVPDKASKALCKYTEMVDEIIRVQKEKMNQGSEIARSRIAAMGLPSSLHAFDGNFSFPAEIKQQVESVMEDGGPASLNSEIQELGDLRKINQEMLLQTDQILVKEERQDYGFRTRFGKRWSRPQSHLLTKNFHEDLQKVAANLKQAANSDAQIERSIEESSELIAILYHRPIESALPSFGREMLSFDKNKDALVGTLKQSLLQLEALGSQRASFEEMLEEMKRKDDIISKFMSTSGSPDDLFKKEIMKYDPLCLEISQNIEAQERLLLQIQEQNKDFGKIFNAEEYKASCDKSCQQIVSAVEKVKEIKQNINEGRKFYLSLQDALSTMKQQCSDFAMTRTIESGDLISGLQTRMEGFRISHKKPGH